MKGVIDMPLRQCMGNIAFTTKPSSMTEVTERITAWLNEQQAKNGLLTVFIKHTSASLTIQENADEDVQKDLLNALSDLAPETAPYRHDAEGPDDMPAHIKSNLTDTSIAIPVKHGNMDLGTWQGVYIIEHRNSAHKRHLSLHFLGE